MNLVSRTTSYILRDHLRVRAYKKYTGHFLDVCLKHIRLKDQKCSKACMENNFSKNFYSLTKKCSRWKKNLIIRMIERMPGKVLWVQTGHCLSSVMVLWGISWNGVTPIHFSDPAMRRMAKVYVETVLEPVVQPLLIHYSRRRSGSFNKIQHLHTNLNSGKIGSKKMFPIP